MPLTSPHIKRERRPWGASERALVLWVPMGLVILLAAGGLFSVRRSSGARKLEGGPGDISRMAFSADGKYLAAFSGLEKSIPPVQLYVWQVSSGQVLRKWTLPLNGGLALCGAPCFSPDGLKVATGGRGMVFEFDIRKNTQTQLPLAGFAGLDFWDDHGLNLYTNTSRAKASGLMDPATGRILSKTIHPYGAATRLESPGGGFFAVRTALQVTSRDPQLGPFSTLKPLTEQDVRPGPSGTGGNLSIIRAKTGECIFRRPGPDLEPMWWKSPSVFQGIEQIVHGGHKLKVGVHSFNTQTKKESVDWIERERPFYCDTSPDHRWLVFHHEKEVVAVEMGSHREVSWPSAIAETGGFLISPDEKLVARASGAEIYLEPMPER